MSQWVSSRSSNPQIAIIHVIPITLSHNSLTFFKICSRGNSSLSPTSLDADKPSTDGARSLSFVRRNRSTRSSSASISQPRASFRALSIASRNCPFRRTRNSAKRKAVEAISSINPEASPSCFVSAQHLKFRSSDARAPSNPLYHLAVRLYFQMTTSLLVKPRKYQGGNGDSDTGPDSGAKATGTPNDPKEMVLTMVEAGITPYTRIS
ncbi:hypothetical protein F5879DRAFT_724312 [Lentinula edodes]|nr:hypothetical protein F5879DRAFT_724312 [Lentinula edodes]